MNAAVIAAMAACTAASSMRDYDDDDYDYDDCDFGDFGPSNWVTAMCCVLVVGAAFLVLWMFATCV